CTERPAYNLIPTTLSSRVCVHAVSVGDTLPAAPMSHALPKRHPDTPILVTTTTPTGSDRVKAIFGNQVHHVYFPWEVPLAWSRFFQAYNPKLAKIGRAHV